jgi:hypothetical protein
MKYGLRCPCHGVRLYETARQRDAYAITFQCKQEWFRIEEAARDEAARLVGQAADALATIARIRPEIGSLLDDVGVTRDLRRALELLRADEVAA